MRKLSDMASHESAKKSVRKASRQRSVNQGRMSRIRTFIKQLEKNLSTGGSKEDLLSKFSAAQKEIQRGVSKHVIHKNAAARKVSHLHHRLKIALGETVH
jgi:small subunit ribosomal protein S20